MDLPVSLQTYSEDSETSKIQQQAADAACCLVNSVKDRSMMIIMLATFNFFETANKHNAQSGLSEDRILGSIKGNVDDSRISAAESFLGQILEQLCEIQYLSKNLFTYELTHYYTKLHQSMPEEKPSLPSVPEEPSLSEDESTSQPTEEKKSADQPEILAEIQENQPDPDEEKISINSADLDALCSLDGIGKHTANLILSYREKNGSFSECSDLLKVKGIGKKTLLKIESKICL